MPNVPVPADSEDVLDAAGSSVAPQEEDGGLVRDPALDDLAEQACLQTNATGAALALASGDDFVCVATTGDTAPDFGARLNTESGLSAFCLRSREMQHCADTETDPRVHSQVCRQLGVRSVLVVPLLQGERLVGVFEIFSPVPQAFSDHDIQALYALSWQVIDHLALPSEVELRQPLALDAINVSEIENEPEPSADFPSHSLLFGSLVPPAEASQDESGQGAESYPQFKMMQTPAKERRTTLLAIAVIVMALILGWVLGRGRPKNAPAVPPPQTKQQPVTPPAEAVPRPRGDFEVTPPQEQPAAADAVAVPAEPEEQAAPKQPSPRKSSKSSPSAPASNGLVIYKQGKIIFQSGPESQQAAADAGSAASDQSSSTPPVEIPAATANTYIVHRVEPEYPESALAQRVQGDVVLQAVVDDDGSVQQLRVVSGDSRLLTAAIDAVRRWEFRPYAPNGQATRFATRITVNFALPQAASTASNQ